MSWEVEKETLGREITRSLYDQRMIFTWYRDNPQGWTLVSGLWSPYYISLRPITSYPLLYQKIGHVMGKTIEEEAGYRADGSHRVVGVAMAGIPIANAITLLHGIPSCWTRKIDAKTEEEFDKRLGEYGKHAMVEGEINDRDTLAVCDDLVTRLDSKKLARRQVEYEAKRRKLEGVKCTDVAVLLDREQGAREEAVVNGMKLYSVIPFISKGLDWLSDVMSREEQEVIRGYITDPKKYQGEEVKTELARMARVC